MSVGFVGIEFFVRVFLGIVFLEIVFVASCVRGIMYSWHHVFVASCLCEDVLYLCYVSPVCVVSGISCVWRVVLVYCVSGVLCIWCIVYLVYYVSSISCVWCWCILCMVSVCLYV